MVLFEREGTRSPADALAEEFHRATACAGCAIKTDPCAGPDLRDQPSHAAPLRKENATSKTVIRRVGMRVEVDVAGVTVSQDRLADAVKCRGLLGTTGGRDECREVYRRACARASAASKLLGAWVWADILTTVIRRE
jgi:hypothetical protein